MKRIIVAATTAAALGISAVPASAAVTKVNAAKNAVAWDSEDVDTDEAFVLCDVYVQDFGDDPYVSLACFGTEGYGRAWVRVKVPGVRGRVTRVRAGTTGDCDGREITWRKRRTKVLVTVAVTAESECEVRAIRVRSTR